MLPLVLALACVPPGPTGDVLPPGQTDPFDSTQEGAPMWGYSWVDDTLAVMPKPRSDDLPGIAADGVDLLVTLTEGPLDAVALQEAGLDSLHLPIEDFHAPTDAQMRDFVAAVLERRTRGERVGVHCLAGRGRSGTMAAVWFVDTGMTGEEAIAHVRELRPGSIETDEQEAAVLRYAEGLP